VTKDNGFPFDLGWDLVSYETRDFPCSYSDEMEAALVTCQLRAGTTFAPALVTVGGFANSIGTGVTYYIEIPKFKNGLYD